MIADESAAIAVGSSQDVIYYTHKQYILTMACEDERCAAGVSDTVAVVSTVLTLEQIQLVNVLSVV